MRRTTPLACALTLTAAVLGTSGAVASPRIASLANSGANTTAAAEGGALSADGRYIAFTSIDDLTGASAAGARQIYVRDRVTATTVLASANANGIAAAAPGVDDPPDQRGYAISGDGRFVVFASQAANLVTSDPDGGDMDVFRKDLRTGAIRLISRTPGGLAANGPVAGDPDVSFDGSRIVYQTGAATNLWTGDVSAGGDVVVSDLVMGTTVLASVATPGGALTGVSHPALSADGRIVAFEDDGAVVVRDLPAATTAAVAPAGTAPDLSGDGRVVVFQNGSAVIRHDRLAATSSTVTPSGGSPTVSADGTRVVYGETAAAVPGDANGVADVYALTLPGEMRRLSQRDDGGEVTRPAARPVVSTDGGTVAFDLDDAPGQTLDGADADGAPDVLATTLAPSDALGPVVVLAGPADGSSVSAPSIAVSGTVSDPSGVVSVRVNGTPAAIGPAGAFAVELPLAVGATAISVVALDGAGRVSERRAAVARSASQGAAAGATARARLLRVFRAGRATRAKFVLDSGATRVTLRLWRRVAPPGRPSVWVPAARPKTLVRRPGTRIAIVSPRPLSPGIYQVRVTVVSPAGAAVGVARHVVARRTQRR